MDLLGASQWRAEEGRRPRAPK